MNKTKTAFNLIRLGISFIPIARVNKIPALPWKAYQRRVPTRYEALNWFNKFDYNIGIVCGKVSGGLAVIDFDSGDFYHQVENLIPEGLPVVKTGNGYHVYFKSESSMRNAKVAMGEGGGVLAELRGEGGMAIAPPSRLSVDREYSFVRGSFSDIPVVGEEIKSLLDELSKYDCKDTTTVYTLEDDTAGSPSYSEPITVASIEGYVRGVVNGVSTRIDESSTGERNHVLYYSSAQLGSLVGGGHMTATEAAQVAYEASIKNGLVGDDGRRAVMKTIESGIKRGMQNPIIIRMDEFLDDYEHRGK